MADRPEGVETHVSGGLNRPSSVPETHWSVTINDTEFWIEQRTDEPGSVQVSVSDHREGAWARVSSEDARTIAGALLWFADLAEGTADRG